MGRRYPTHFFKELFNHKDIVASIDDRELLKIEFSKAENIQLRHGAFRNPERELVIWYNSREEGEYMILNDLFETLEIPSSRFHEICQTKNCNYTGDLRENGEQILAGILGKPMSLMYRTGGRACDMLDWKDRGDIYPNKLPSQ